MKGTVPRLDADFAARTNRPSVGDGGSIRDGDAGDVFDVVERFLAKL